MIYEYLFFLLISISLALAGWKITFTKGGMEWMYKNKIWKKDDAIFDRLSGEVFDRVRASGLFFLGLMLTFFVLYRIWIDILSG